MHRNLGHLPNVELLKLLAMNGITSDQVIKATKALQCAACMRSKGPFKPNPASQPQYVGQFTDNLQCDIFYLRDITTRNYPILGIICEATHLHVATRLESRVPSHVAEQFRKSWLNAFGFPLKLTTDDDGAFESDFAEMLEEGGTYLNIVPAEAHNQMAVIERHNGTLRMLLERIVDSKPCSSPEEIDLALTSATYAKNAATWSTGRPPFVAAFGRIPRVGLDLFCE